jgi:hypothetical protein
MRQTRTILQTLVLAAAAVLAVAAPAGALAPLPTGNLVRNGDEANVVSPDGYFVASPLQTWARVPSNSSVTRVRYGVPGFPTTAQAAEMGAGTMFFAGGPSTAADTGPAFSNPLMWHPVIIPAEAQPYIAAGEVQITLSACLGGYANQDDYVSIEGGAHRFGEDRLPSDVSMSGPRAAERDFQTKLLPVSVTALLPPGASAYTIVVYFHRTSGQRTYNDAYADKIEARLSELGSTPPAPNCTAPRPPGGPVGDPTGTANANPTGAALSAQPSDSNTAVPLRQAARRISLTKRYALVRLRCAARDEACGGTLTLNSAIAKLGSAKFAIAVGRTATIKVKLGTKARRALARLSARRLARLKITATARVGVQTTTFTFGAKR